MRQKNAIIRDKRSKIFQIIICTITTSMDIILKFIPKLWNIAARISFIQKPLIVGQDMSRTASFLAKKSARLAQIDAVYKCQTLEEQFELSALFFGPHQIKYEIISFLEFAKTERPEHLCEIGTADGGTNFLMSQALPSARLMIGVDLYVKNKVKLHYFSRQKQEISFIDGSSYVPRTLEKVRHILGQRKLDLLFIDGDHSYEGVKQDFLNYRHLVRDGGIIAFHDIVPDYLTRYGIQTGRWVGEVPRFWSQVKSLYPFYEFVEDANQDGLGIGAIRYDSHIAVPENF